jgi:hypothetical protein
MSAGWHFGLVDGVTTNDSRGSSARSLIPSSSPLWECSGGSGASPRTKSLVSGCAREAREPIPLQDLRRHELDRVAGCDFELGIDSYGRLREGCVQHPFGRERSRVPFARLASSRRGDCLGVITADNELVDGPFEDHTYIRGPHGPSRNPDLAVASILSAGLSRTANSSPSTMSSARLAPFTKRSRRKRTRSPFGAVRRSYERIEPLRRLLRQLAGIPAEGHCLRVSAMRARRSISGSRACRSARNVVQDMNIGDPPCQRPRPLIARWWRIFRSYRPAQCRRLIARERGTRQAGSSLGSPKRGNASVTTKLHCSWLGCSSRSAAMKPVTWAIRSPSRVNTSSTEAT